MLPMLLTASTEVPIGNEWLYETKYDGFRCILEWDKEPLLKSRNGKLLNNMFPEIISFCHEIYGKIKPFLPLTMDGELVHLVNNFQSDFSKVQLRGRMKNIDTIKNNAELFTCHYVVFDLLIYKGKDLTKLPLTKRKQQMSRLFNKVKLPVSINYQDTNRLQAINVYEDSPLLWDRIVTNNGEGLIAKQTKSTWNSAERTNKWLKIKNWRYISIILTKYDKSNGFFHGVVYQNGLLVEVVTFRHGLSEVELATLITLFQTKGTQLSNNIWELEPSICVEIACIEFDGKKLREPRFHLFKLNTDIQDCSWEQMQKQLYPLPPTTKITHPDKPIWPKSGIQKDDYLMYLQRIAPYMLPFLKDRLLTVIRFPHGVPGESFYQKNSPDYVPDFVATKKMDDINYIMCNDLETLLWLGNQLALEFHIPFQTVHTNNPTEIVFDLDPPSVKEFSLAVEAAQQMKVIFDQFRLHSFVKTSGGKGIQLYIPLEEDSFTYEETGIFTKFICDFLVEQQPKWFTTERLKKNRDNKLYLDYVQHKEGKTIVAPFSPRGNELGLIATPLRWEEVKDSLKPDTFTIPSVLDRITKQGDPFKYFRVNSEKDNFAMVLKQLKDLIKK
ncbi:bifunctional non-homologous end joining protein LigD [Psychrobacillus psychrotolerans]|uniref:Bifunctional non-homologous end joining protein LigD n=1 Tax=Psychrobacillus psychrotolerans TaxID=126156 RepID=A0A1I5VEF6_9BACI|nr:DNA ligase D [Psychrobacillus psychrotolerans]SFQ05771.1 bifunctional non-homologous end joining protein LigD [Psychrobacillus psychrotolerans]